MTVRRVLLVAGLVAGGVGRHVAQLAAGLTEAGHQVRVGCPEVVAARFRLAETGAEVVAVNIGSGPHPWRDRTAVADLRAAAEEVDVMHAHGLRAGALSVLARDAARTALVVTTHNAAPQGRLAAVVHRGLERLVCGRADLVLGVSDDLEEQARSRGASTVGRAVVAAVRAEPQRDAATVRDELGVPADHHVVLAVGRLAAQKGFDRLLELVKTAELKDLPLSVLIAGDGPQRAQLQRQVDRESLPVRLLGHRDDIPDLLGAADLTVSTARWEGQPVWMQEALSVGAPIVATDVGGTAEVLGDGGELVPDDDLDTFAAVVARCLTEADYRAQLRQRALRRAAELPTEQDAVAAALLAYENAGEPGAGSPE